MCKARVQKSTQRVVGRHTWAAQTDGKRFAQQRGWQAAPAAVAVGPGITLRVEFGTQLAWRCGGVQC